MWGGHIEVFKDLFTTFFEIYHVCYKKQELIKSNDNTYVFFITHLKLLNLYHGVPDHKMNRFFEPFIDGFYPGLKGSIKLTVYHHFILYEIYLNLYVNTHIIDLYEIDKWYDQYKIINSLNNSRFVNHKYIVISDLKSFDPKFFSDDFFLKNGIEHTENANSSFYWQKNFSKVLFFTGFLTSAYVFLAD